LNAGAHIIGGSVKVGRGRGGRVTLENGLRGIVNARVVENEADLKASLKIFPGRVVLDVRVPPDTLYRPIWLLTLSLEGRRGRARAYVAILPVDEESKRKVVREALRDDKSYSVGALSVAKMRGAYYMAYRWRNGDEARGQWLEIARSEDGLEYEEIVKRFNKEDYGYQSFEQPCFIKNSPDTTLLYCADSGSKWDIYLVQAKCIEDLDLPGRRVIEHGKDPAALYDNGRYIVVYSNTRNPGHDLTVLETEDFENFRVLSESVVYSQLTAQGNSWARTHIHAGAIMKSGDYYVLLYDALPKKPSCFGSGWLGMAVSRDLETWIDLTPKAPIWRGNGVDYTFRYVDIVAESNKYVLYAEEEATEAGRKDIVAYYD